MQPSRARTIASLSPILRYSLGQFAVRRTKNDWILDTDHPIIQVVYGFLQFFWILLFILCLHIWICKNNGNKQWCSTSRPEFATLVSFCITVHVPQCQILPPSGHFHRVVLSEEQQKTPNSPLILSPSGHFNRVVYVTWPQGDRTHVLFVFNLVLFYLCQWKHSQCQILSPSRPFHRVIFIICTDSLRLARLATHFDFGVEYT